MGSLHGPPPARASRSTSSLGMTGYAADCDQDNAGALGVGDGPATGRRVWRERTGHCGELAASRLVAKETDPLAATVLAASRAVPRDAKQMSTSAAIKARVLITVRFDKCTHSSWRAASSGSAVRCFREMSILTSVKGFARPAAVRPDVWDGPFGASARPCG